MRTFSAGDVIAQKYRVERTLGTGGMGYVVAARHLHLGHLVALKFVRAGMLEGEEAYKRFFREAKSAARLRSDHVCRVLDVALLDDKTPYMVMEYLEGCDLSSLMKEKGPLDVTEACDYVLQACEGLAEAHAAGIVHRDIKPANLFVTRGPGGGPLIKVLDFGISKDEPLKDDTSGVTGTKAMLGSPRFMSPEQIRDPRTVDPRSDVWSLGVVLYRLLTGKWPFEAENLGALIARVATAKPTDPREYAPEIPHEVAQIILRCLEKTRDARFGSVGELAHSLAQFTATPELSRLSVERVYDLLASPSSGEVLRGRPLADESTGWGATGVAFGRASGLSPYVGVGALAVIGLIGALAANRYSHREKPARAPVLAEASYLTRSQPSQQPVPGQQAQQMPLPQQSQPQIHKSDPPRTEPPMRPSAPVGALATSDPRAVSNPPATADVVARSPSAGAAPAQPTRPIEAQPTETAKAKTTPVRRGYGVRPANPSRGSSRPQGKSEDTGNGIPASRD